MNETAGDPETTDAKRTRVLVSICYVVCCFIWGTTWYAVRVSVEPGDGYPPNFAGAIRFLISIVLYLPLVLIYARKLGTVSKKEFLWITVAGLLNGFYQCFIHSAERSISGGLASVLMATTPLMVASIAFTFGVERVRRNTVIGFLISLTGIALVCVDRLNTSKEQFTGIVLTLVAALFTSCSNISLKTGGTRVHPILSASIFLVATDIPVWIASLIMNERASLFPLGAPFAAVFYMSVMSSVVAFLLYLYMLRHISLMAISTLQFVIPVLALVIDMFLEHRVTLNPQVWAGIAVVLGGVAFSMRRH